VNTRAKNVSDDSFHTLVGYPVIKLDDAFVVHGPQTTKDARLPRAHRHKVSLPTSVYKAIEGCFWADGGIHFTFECDRLPARFTMSTEQLGDLIQLLEKRTKEIDVDYLSVDNHPLYVTLRQMRKTTARLRREYEWWEKEE
jgi:hypothetical protein